MMYKNVSFNHGAEHNILHKETNQMATFSGEIWTAISFSPDPNDNQSEFDIPFIEPPPLFFERRLDYINLKQYGKRNVSWAMQYGKLEKEACLTECNKINHEIPTMNFIETEKLKS